MAPKTNKKNPVNVETDTVPTQVSMTGVEASKEARVATHKALLARTEAQMRSAAGAHAIAAAINGQEGNTEVAAQHRTSADQLTAAADAAKVAEETRALLTGGLKDGNKQANLDKKATEASVAAGLDVEGKSHADMADAHEAMIENLKTHIKLHVAAKLAQARAAKG